MRRPSLDSVISMIGAGLASHWAAPAALDLGSNGT